MLKQFPKHLDLNEYCFCLPREYDYGAKTYKGVELYYFNVIKKDMAYLIPKKNLDNLYCNNNNRNRTLYN